MRSALALVLLLCACHDDPAGARDAAARDLGGEASARDASAPEAGAHDRAPSAELPRGDGPAPPKPDAATSELAPKPDLGLKPDAPKPDLGLKPDAPKPDAPKPDALKPDLTKPKPDLGLKPEASSPTGLKVPCKQGPGFTLFLFHYGGGGTSPTIDVWDATCSYSYAPSSACNVVAVYPGFGSVSYTSQGYPILTSSEYLRVRFSVAGLAFSKATVHLQARSYATSSSTSFRVWSPLYGDAIGGPVDNDWVYDWYSLDWTGFLAPSDPPSLTAIQIYAHQGSGQLAVQAVELCVQ